MINHMREIETAVRANAGAWQAYFRQHGEASWQCILFPSVYLTESEYHLLASRLSAPPPAELTAEERKRNILRHRARVADERA